MANQIIPDEDGKGVALSFKQDDVKFTDPIKYLEQYTITTRMHLFEQHILLQQPEINKGRLRKEAIIYGLKGWDKHFKELMETAVPEQLFALLDNPSKNDQMKLLRNLELSPEILMSFIFKAFLQYGYTYSQYRSENYTKDVDPNSLPYLAYVDPKTGTVKKRGESSLSDGQIKKALEQRKVVSTKFVDKGANWHCFFITYGSIKGKETWRDGQPHFHYISDKFGIPRDEAVQKFKSGNYPYTNVHIALKGYGNQPKK